MSKVKKKFPLVSIIINCLNGEKYLANAIKSVLDQTYKNWEIIFFDNNSVDKSVAIVKKFSDKRIKIFKSKKTYTLYKARNLAIQKAKGEFISFLDVDDCWLNNKIKTQIDYFKKNKKIEVVFSNLFIFKEKSSKKEIYIKNFFFNNFNAQSLINNFQMPILTTMIKKDVFRYIRFNNKYTIIGDFDFSVRLSLIKKIYYIPEPLAIYRYHDSNLTNKRIDLNIRELKYWLKNISKKRSFHNINFDSIKDLIELLTIKKNIILNKKILSLKLIFKRPIILKKLKYFFILLINSWIKIL